MTVVPTRPSVTTTASKIAENTDATNTRSYVIKNLTGTAAVFLGGGNIVTASNGFQWDTTDGPFSVELEPGEELWAIVAVTTQTLHAIGGGT